MLLTQLVFLNRSLLFPSCSVQSSDSKSKGKLSIRSPTILLASVSYLTRSCLKSKLKKIQCRIKLSLQETSPACGLPLAGQEGRKPPRQQQEPRRTTPASPGAREPHAPPRTRRATQGAVLGSGSRGWPAMAERRLSEGPHVACQPVFGNPRSPLGTGQGRSGKEASLWQGKWPSARKGSKPANWLPIPKKPTSCGRTSMLLNTVLFKREVREG